MAALDTVPFRLESVDALLLLSFRLSSLTATLPALMHFRICCCRGSAVGTAVMSHVSLLHRHSCYCFPALKKMAQMILFTKQKLSHRRGKQTYGFQGGDVVG